MKIRTQLLVGLALMLSAATVFAQDDTDAAAPYALQVCDWGIVVVEPVAPSAPQMITLDAPQDNAGIEGTSFTVSGTSVGLEDTPVLVEVVADASGSVIYEGAAIVTTEGNADAPAEWSLNVDLGELDGATAVTLKAYAADDSTIAADDIALNVNSSFGLPFVEITSPALYEGVETAPLVIEGQAGAIFENNIVVQILDETGEDVLAETFATVQTDELAGRGSWSVALDVLLDAGTRFEVRAFQPAIADGETVTVEASSVGYADPFSVRYERVLKIFGDDPLNAASPVNCDAALAEFDNDEILPIMVNELLGASTSSMMPTVNLTIEAAGSSICPLPIRARLVLAGDDYTGDLYRDASGEPVACTMDLAPISVDVPLGTQPVDQFNVTVNGVSLNE